MKQIFEILQKAENLEFLNMDEGFLLYRDAPLGTLMHSANKIRFKIHPEPRVGWIIDRNVNYTNVCISGCKFCNFYCGKKSEKAYITTMEEYEQKIEVLFEHGGDQLLLQGGLHPDLGLKFYSDLFSSLKAKYPSLKLHALGPPEIVHIAKLEGTDYQTVLTELVNSGLDSLPGAGAEILVDRVRQFISKNKCTTQEWLDVMRVAHQMKLTTSATMMLGHAETVEERFEHLLNIRRVQEEKPKDAKGFISFIPWPFQDEGTSLKKRFGIENTVSSAEYIRFIAISRIMLPNIRNIQASWLTVGKPTGQICLHAGANDFGSIMIEENVVSVAGANHKMDVHGIQKSIEEAGFVPARRNQQFEFI